MSFWHPNQISVNLLSKPAGKDEILCRIWQKRICAFIYLFILHSFIIIQIYFINNSKKKTRCLRVSLLFNLSWFHICCILFTVEIFWYILVLNVNFHCGYFCLLCKLKFWKYFCYYKTKNIFERSGTLSSLTYLAHVRNSRLKNCVFVVIYEEF